MSTRRDEASSRAGAQRRPFVGRTRELAALRAALDAAYGGDGSIWTVLGEPGIGKTSLCQEIADFAKRGGGQVLIGHCYEEGSATLPYLPFVQALKGYVLQRPIASLTDELGSGAAEVARVIPEVTDRLGVQAPEHDPLDVEDHRYRLFQALTEFLLRIAAAQPLLLIMEDLHDADQGTLDLLLHVSRQLAGQRLLIVGTYRDLEVDRAHPLAAALTGWRRTAHFGAAKLGGLTATEVQELLTALGVPEAGMAVAEVVQTRTDGNPLFVRELARFVEDAWTNTSAPGHRKLAERSQLLSRLPDGLRDGIGKRLSRLNPATQRLLSVAAVIGREVDLTVLRSVAGFGEHEFTAALEDAVRAGLLQECAQPGAVVYQFTHALVRQTLYEEIIAPRRLRLHQEVARALEAHFTGRLQQHAAELAEHFAQSTEAGDLSKAVTYHRTAARNAVSVFAFREAARQLSRALQVLDVIHPDATDQRCDLHLELAEVLIPAGQPRVAVEEVVPPALELALALADDRRVSRAAQVALEGMLRYGGAALEASAVFRTWAERADQYAAPDSVERVYADHALGNHAFLIGDASAALAYFSRALALARRLGDREALYRSAWKMVQWIGDVDHQDEVIALASEVAASPRVGVNPRTEADFLWHAAIRHLIHCDRERFHDLAQEVAAIADRTQEPAVLWRPLVRGIIEQTLDGHLETALQGTERLIERAEEMGIGMLGRVQAYSWSLPIRLYLGSFDDRVATDFNEKFWREQIINLPTYAMRGDAARAHEVLDQFMARLPPAHVPDATNVTWLVLALEGAILLEDRTAAGVLREKLAPSARLGGEPHAFSLVGRLLGDAALMCGDPRTARLYYEQALGIATSMQHRPEIALLHLNLAELLPRAEAEAHLDRAIPALETMRMRPALERALALREIAAVDPLTAREREVAVLLAAGLTNRAIAERLVITEGTAEVHVKHIMNKLGLASRTQVAVWASERGIVSTASSRAGSPPTQSTP